MSSGSGHGGHGRRRKHHEEHEEHENHERWAVSYADMMTVLVGLFIVLFAMSQVDEVKFEELRRSLSIGFGNDAPSMMVGGSGVLSGLDTYEISPNFTSTAIDGDIAEESTPATGLSEEQENYDLAVTEYERLETIADDECVEVTPSNIRIRKVELVATIRNRETKRRSNEDGK